MYENMELDFVIVVDRGRESKRAVDKIGPTKFERRFVEIPAVEGRSEVDTEDLVDRLLYYEAFKEAYRGILDRIPSIDVIDGDSTQKRSDNYRTWFKKSEESYSKTLVAQHMFSVVLDDKPARNDPDRAKALEKTSNSFAGLFAAIKAKYADTAP